MNNLKGGEDMDTAVNANADDLKFLEMANNPTIRPSLLARLQELKLLSAFLAAENGTTE